MTTHNILMAALAALIVAFKSLKNVFKKTKNSQSGEMNSIVQK